MPPSASLLKSSQNSRDETETSPKPSDLGSEVAVLRVLNVGGDKVGDEANAEAGPGCRRERLLAKHLGRNLGADDPREGSPRGSEGGNPCESENESVENERQRRRAQTQDEQMKQAAIRRLARDPVGVELDVVIPPTMHWHANMAVAPTAMTKES